MPNKPLSNKPLSNKPKKWRLRARTKHPAGHELQTRLGYFFKDLSLLRRALTHSSWTNMNPGDDHNERLEFLGDAVLGFAVTSHIFEEYPDLAEGKLSKLRAAVVSTDSLGQVAREIGLDKHILKDDKSVRNIADSSIMGNTVEALIGAVYLDGGAKAAKKVALSLVISEIQRAAQQPGGKDWKTLLQERLAKEMRRRPDYVVVSQGTSAEPRFLATVRLGGKEIGRGEGGSKKQAEQEAAKRALSQL